MKTFIVNLHYDKGNENDEGNTPITCIRYKAKDGDLYLNQKLNQRIQIQNNIPEKCTKTNVKH